MEFGYNKTTTNVFFANAKLKNFSTIYAVILVNIHNKYMYN